MSYPPEPPSSESGYGGPSESGYGGPSGSGYGTPPGAGYGGPGYGPGYGQMPVSPTNGKATASLVTGIASLVLSWCCGLGVVGVVAIVLGVKARSEIRDSGGRQQGDGLALGGIITGAVAVVLGLLVLVLIIVALAQGFHLRTGSGSGAQF